jgi:predicted dehydrogenase
LQVRNIFMSTRFWIPPAPFQGLEIVGVADADNAARLKIAENYVIPSFATLDELLQSARQPQEHVLERWNGLATNRQF